MSKLYNDRYVKTQTPRCSTGYPSRSGGRGPIETLICVAIGAVITLVLCWMGFAVMKPLLAAHEAMCQEQQERVNVYDSILSQ